MSDVDWESIERHFKEAAQLYYSFAEKLATLSTGALALSITLRSQFVPQSPKCLGLLSLSWIFFIISIFCSLLVHWGRSEFHREFAMELQKGKRLTIKVPKRRYQIAMYSTLLSFLVAMLLLTLFAILNHT